MKYLYCNVGFLGTRELKQDFAKNLPAFETSSLDSERDFDIDIDQKMNIEPTCFCFLLRF